MASKYLMQARSQVAGVPAHLYTWRSVAPDFSGFGYAGPGSPIDVACCGGGLDISVVDAGVDVVAVSLSGAYAVSAAGAWAVLNRKIAVSISGATAVSASGAWAVNR